jgi:hypothetical protein
MAHLTNLIETVTRGDLESVRAILDANDELINQWDESGATPLHYAALNGHREIARLLVERGAEINSTDSQFGATPTPPRVHGQLKKRSGAGWAIEYLREMGGCLSIELDDLAYAIQLGDARWVERFLKRFPSFREASDTKGKPFRQLVRESGNGEIANFFGLAENRKTP